MKRFVLPLLPLLLALMSGCTGNEPKSVLKEETWRNGLEKTLEIALGGGERSALNASAQQLRAVLEDLRIRHDCHVYLPVR